MATIIDVVVELLWKSAVMSNPINRLTNGLAVTSSTDATTSLPSMLDDAVKRSIDRKKKIRTDEIYKIERTIPLVLAI